MNEILGCIFDFGNTLVKENKFDCKSGLENVIKYVKHNPFLVNAEMLADLLYRVDTEMGRVNGRIECLGNLEYAQIPSLKFVFDYYQLKFDYSEEFLEFLFWEGATKATPVEDSLLMLKTLQSQNIKLGVISNISFSQYALKKRLEQIFPEIYFDCIISSATFGFRKPSPFIFELSKQVLGIDKNNLLFIGDRIREDFEGANDFGINAALFGESVSEKYSNILYFKTWSQFLLWFNNRKE